MMPQHTEIKKTMLPGAPYAHPAPKSKIKNMVKTGQRP